jgi:hypothetical protein
MRVASLSLLSLVAASGCAGARWSVVDARPLQAITVGPAEVDGPVDVALVQRRRSEMIAALRARGYAVLADQAPGVPSLTMTVKGELVDDSRLHAPDDRSHHIYNDLHYQFVAYDVHVDVVNAAGKILACGNAQASQDPARAMTTLTALIARDVPPATATLAAR